MSEWISVEDELPELETWVLCWDSAGDGYPDALFVESYDLAVLSGEEYSPVLATVTHWKLIEPPSEDE